jgi:hypothetical protein
MQDFPDFRYPWIPPRIGDFLLKSTILFPPEYWAKETLECNSSMLSRRCQTCISKDSNPFGSSCSPNQVCLIFKIHNPSRLSHWKLEEKCFQRETKYNNETNSTKTQKVLLKWRNIMAKNYVKKWIVFLSPQVESRICAVSKDHQEVLDKASQTTYGGRWLMYTLI